MKVKILNFENKECGDLDLSEDVFGCEVRDDIIKRVVQWQLDKRRSGNHKTKGISEISGTTKKPYKQKGTGNARHGSLRTNIHRGGAVIFGPVVRDHSHSLQKKLRAKALKMALSQKLKEKKLIVVSDYQMKDHKTSSLNAKLKGMSIENALFIGLEVSDECKNFKLAQRNLKGFDVLPVVGINVLDILKKDSLVISQQSIQELEKRFK